MGRGAIPRAWVGRHPGKWVTVGYLDVAYVRWYGGMLMPMVGSPPTVQCKQISSKLCSCSRVP